MKKLLTNKYVQFVLVFVVGGVIATMLLPEKIKIKVEKEEVVKEVVVEKEVVKYVDREVIKEVKVVSSERVVKREEIFPDGHIIREEITESNSEQVSRIAAEERQRYEAAIKVKEAELVKKYTYNKEVINPKEMNLFGGIGIDTDRKLVYYGGVNKPIFGPFTFGAIVTSEKLFGVSLGVRF